MIGALKIATEAGRIQNALWVRLGGKPLFSIRLVKPYERFPRKLVFSWGAGAGYTSPWGFPHLRRRWWSDNGLYIEWSGFTAHLRLGRYRYAAYHTDKNAPWAGVTMNANRWL